MKLSRVNDKMNSNIKNNLDSKARSGFYFFNGLLRNSNVFMFDEILV